MADGESAVTLIRTRAAKGIQCRLVQLRAGVGEAAEDHLRQGGRSRQRIDDGLERDAGRAFSGEAINAGGNCWKGHGCEPVRVAELHRAAIAGGEQVVLAERAAVPHRPNRVNHVPGLEPIALGDLGIAGLAAVEHPALGHEVGPRSAMDRAIDAAPAKERRIRRVDDGVNAQAGDVGNDDFQPRRADLARKPAQAEAAALTVTPLSANSCCNSPAWNISRMMSQPPTNSPLT
jgi:hypothetical protein